ncbi:hypothetical protein [Mycolicibacterium cosmeticum]|uniref:hypothetical protein n=1 Tax=Mycolicibacterium cosmeticum TaxID=258533 RepID=UPI003204B482
MTAADYRDAWAIIKARKSDRARQIILESVEDANRLPVVTLALIRLAALLAHASEVDRDFTQQLVYANVRDTVARILGVTDQILAAIDAEQRPGAWGLVNQLDAIPEQLALRDAAPSEVGVDT